MLNLSSESLAQHRLSISPEIFERQSYFQNDGAATLKNEATPPVLKWPQHWIDRFIRTSKTHFEISEKNCFDLGCASMSIILPGNWITAGGF